MSDTELKEREEMGVLRAELKSAIPKLTGDDIEWIIGWVRAYKPPIINYCHEEVG
jgi:hypothetical protein